MREPIEVCIGMNELIGLRSVLDEREWTLLGDLLEAVVPSGGEAMEYLEQRFTTGRLDIEDVRGALAGSEPAGPRLEVWSTANPGTSEARWFETLRGWAWEALLCDPAWGGNQDERGWRRFGYAGRPKSAGQSDPS